MATNAVIDLHRSRNRRHQAVPREVSSLRPDRAAFDRRPKVLQFPAQGPAVARRRVSAAVVLGIVAIGLLWVGYLGVAALAEHASTAPAWLSSQSQQDGRFDSREVVVRTGDTLWSIARNYGPAGVDVRQTIDWIRRSNQLTGATVYPGQVLKVPVVRNDG